MSETINLREVNQFQPNKSQYMCGFYAVAMVASMSAPGKSPTKSPQQVISTAIDAYAKYNGDVSINNQNGMTLDQLYAVLHDAGLHYQGTTPDSAHLDAWLKLGYPVIVSVNEVNVFDTLLGYCPYPWSPSGSHVVVVTGLDNAGDYLVRDSANCTSLFDPNSLRPGPRHYRRNDFASGLVNATAVVPAWKERPDAGFDPTKEKLDPAVVVVAEHIPSGWRDDGKTLYSPNGIPVVGGFRLHILKGGWDANNWALAKEESVEQLELSNPDLGPGARQVFRLSQLEWQKNKNVVFVGWAGAELLAERAERANANPPLHIDPETKQQLETVAQILNPLCTAIQSLLKGK